MAENNQNSEPVEAEIETKPNFVVRLVNRYPRTAKVVAIAGATTAAVGVALTANTIKNNRAHLELAADHAQDAFQELSTAVSPTDQTA